MVSVDTLHADTARAVCEAGAQIINDVSAANWDPNMADVMAETDAVCVLQHWRGLPGAADERVLKDGSVDTVMRELTEQVERVLAHGVKPERVVIDPGLGFAKTVDSSWQVLANLHEMMRQSEYPILIGHSRKRFIQAVADELASVDDLTSSLTALIAAEGAWAVRVHETQGNVAAIRAGNGWLRASMR